MSTHLEYITRRDSFLKEVTAGLPDARVETFPTGLIVTSKNGGTASLFVEPEGEGLKVQVEGPYLALTSVDTPGLAILNLRRGLETHDQVLAGWP